MDFRELVFSQKVRESQKKDQREILFDDFFLANMIFDVHKDN